MVCEDIFSYRKVWGVFLEHLNQMFSFMKSLPVNMIITFFVAFFERGLLILLFFQMHDKKVRIGNLIIFTSVIVILHIMPAYILGNWLAPILPYYDDLKFLFTLQNPLLFFVYYFLLNKLIPLSKARSVKTAEYLYIMIHVLLMTFITMRFSLLRALNGTIEFNKNPHYLVSDCLAQILQIPLYLLGYFVLFRIFHRLNVYLENSSVVPYKGRSSIICSFVFICLIFTGSYGLIYWMSHDYEHIYLICLVCMILLVSVYLISYLIDQQYLMKDSLKLNEIYISSLNNAIDDFRDLRHDFNNMISVYDSYIALGEYEALIEYHAQVFKEILSASDRMMQLKQIEEKNPILLSLLIPRLQIAEDANVMFDVSTSVSNDLMAYQSLEVIRMLGILLDNAIESAICSERKFVQLYTEKEPDGLLVILSNSTNEEVNVNYIFQKGYTQKSKHMGQGLCEVSKIISRSDTYSIHCTCKNLTFTIYLMLKNISDNKY